MGRIAPLKLNSINKCSMQKRRENIYKKKGEDIGVKIQQLRIRMPKKSSNAVLVGIQLLLFLVILNYYVDFAEAVQEWDENVSPRESRKMFGGYRITPRFCTPTRSSTRISPNSQNRGPSICMFNHECTQRNGEVVGACMDGFLFGACCRISGTPGANKVDQTIESGVVMLLDDKNSKNPSSSHDADLVSAIKLPQLSNVIHDNSNIYYVRTTGRPKDKNKNNYMTSSTEKIDDIASNGVAQIASSLLQGAPEASNIATLMSNSNSEGGFFSHSTISHEEADTVLINKNSSSSMDISRPSDFSSYGNLQTEPSIVTPDYMTMTTPKPSYTYQKPIFRPKPGKVPQSNQDKYVLIPTVTKPHQQIKDTTEKNTPIGSIESIMNMLNDTHPSTLSSIQDGGPESKLTTIEIQHYTTSPNGYTITIDGESVNRPTSGHYITTVANEYTTYHQPSSYLYSSTVTKRPGYSGSTNKYPNRFGATYTKRPTIIKDTTQISTPSSVDNDNNIPTLSYDDYWGSNSDKTPNKNPPSTSYVFSPTPTKRPISNVHNVVAPSYDVSSGGYDTFSSVTPTVIVLSSLDPVDNEYSHTSNPGKFPDKQPTESPPQSQENYVEVPLQPHKKPVHQVTINNIITSNNMIHLNHGKPTTEKPTPTVLITPKPNSGSSTSPSIYTSPSRPSVSIIPNKKPNKKPGSQKPAWNSATTTNPINDQYFSSPDNLINFPPVRNPNLNATGANPTFYNNSVSVGVDDLVLQEVEFTTPAFLQEDEDLNKKMSLFVNKIVGSLQGTFQELHDIVILDKVPNGTIVQQNNKVKPGAAQSDEEKPQTLKPNTTTKKPRTTRRPSSTTTKRATTTKKPAKTTTVKPTTTTIVTTSTKKPTRAPLTTKKPRPTKPKTTVPPVITTVVTDAQVLEEEESFTTETPDGDHRYLCGVRPMVKSGRIVGGKGATFGEYPWQVLVRESTWLGLFTKNKCGGVLITSRYVTTAAHCQPGFLASLVAVFGKYDISTEAEIKRSITKNVRRVIVHRQYDAATFENDLALLELESPVHFDTHIVPICMPTDDADFTGRMATVTGWGRLKYGGGVPSVLQEVKVPIMENNVCQEMFHTAGHTKVILDSFLCAGYANGQKDSCEGDSGGPLVLQRSDGRWELAGTVSHGIKCAAPYLPGVYMRTTFYKPWLRSITGVH